MVPMVSSCLLYTLNHCEELVFFEFELLFTINAILILASWVGGWCAGICFWGIVQQLDVELDERGSSISEVLTPRGVSVKKTYESGHELGPADQLVEQPSPVSVLDNFHFQEEDLTPSPSKTSSGTLDSLQG